MRDLCFVLMPFGKKPDATGALIDFDAVYEQVIRPAIEEAGLEPVRADGEMTGGIIHKPMFERLVLCRYAVADLTTANANVFYELGVRHAVRPWSTVLLFAEGGRLPFDVQPLRALPYALTPEGVPADPDGAKQGLVERLHEARRSAADRPAADSPLFQLLDGYPEPQVDREKTDVFRDRVLYSREARERIARARREGVDALRRVEAELPALAEVESGVVTDLFLSYRAVSAWDEMVRLAERDMPRVLADTVMVREQYALALNRLAKEEPERGRQAEKVLNELIRARGPSSETCGILGRVLKDRWERTFEEGKKFQAPVLLDQAAEAYLQGFEANWTDTYPGINAVTLMELKEPPDPRRQELLPVVRYAAERRIARSTPDYWDFATRLEVAVLERDQAKAGQALGQAQASLREGWEAETTARNLRLIREARERRGEDAAWIAEIERELLATPPHGA